MAGRIADSGVISAMQAEQHERIAAMLRTELQEAQSATDPLLRRIASETLRGELVRQLELADEFTRDARERGAIA